MKLIAVSRIRNEIDILEPFVRHHAQYFDTVIVLDDGSTDGGYDVLRALQAEGLPLVLLREPSLGYHQSSHMTRLMRLAVQQYGADWVAPLDADEFVEPPDGIGLRTLLAGRTDRPRAVPWNNFLWQPSAEASESNPVRRLTRRLPPLSPDHVKVIVPAALAAEPEAALAQGSHTLLHGGVPLASEALEGVNLCHFPVRGVEQFASKIAIGYLQYCATPHWNRAEGFHYIELFRLLAGGAEQFAQALEIASRRYSLETQVPLCAADRDAPLRYVGGPLTLAGRREETLSTVLEYAESLANDRARLVEREDALTAILAQRDRLLDDRAFLERRAADLEAELAILRETLYAQRARPGARGSGLRLPLRPAGAPPTDTSLTEPASSPRRSPAKAQAAGRASPPRTR